MNNKVFGGLHPGATRPPPGDTWQLLETPPVSRAMGAGATLARGPRATPHAALHSCHRTQCLLGTAESYGCLWSRRRIWGKIY